MFDDAVRQTVLDLAFAHGRVAVLASNPEPYALATAARAGATVLALDDVPRLLPDDCAAVVLEGLDDIEDPPALLRALATALPAARVFALVANAAYALSLEAFIGGAALARAHAYVLGELAPLFAASGWTAESISPVTGGDVGDMTFPFDLSAGGVKLRVADMATLQRLQVAGYLVIAQRA